MTGDFEGLETAAPLADLPASAVGELPPELPVLPLKEAVVFPDSMSMTWPPIMPGGSGVSRSPTRPTPRTTARSPSR